MGDSIDQSTWLMPRDGSTVILYEHAVPVVGRGVYGLRKDVSGRPDQLRVRIRFDTDPSNPLGILAEQQHRNGFRDSVSVGFIPGDVQSRKDLPTTDPLHVGPSVDRYRAGYVYRNNELLETSTVGIPANRDAVQLSLHARESDDPDESVRRYVRGSLSRQVADLVLDAVRTDPKIRRAIQAAYLGTPQAPPTPSTIPPRIRVG